MTNLAVKLRELGFQREKGEVVSLERMRPEAERSMVIRTLERAQATPFTPESVAAYKQQKAADATPITWPIAYLMRLLEKREMVVFTFGVLTLAMGAIYLRSPSAELWVGSVGVAVGFALIAFIAFAIEYGIHFRGKAHWRFVDYNPDDKKIPSEVHALASDVAGDLPDSLRVRFRVDELRQNDALLDPFLVLECGDYEYYIAVWGEPSFED